MSTNSANPNPGSSSRAPSTDKPNSQDQGQDEHDSETRAICPIPTEAKLRTSKQKSSTSPSSSSEPNSSGNGKENRRLMIDYMQMKKEPLPFIFAEPLPHNIYEWRYVLRGPSGTPYENGLYHGKLVFPQRFPFYPPAIYMITPNGRFRTNYRLCLSISDYHPDTWNPSWSVGTVLQGILNFMFSPQLEKVATLGGMMTPDLEKQSLAAASYEYNLKDKLFCELFPELAEEMKRELARRAEATTAREPHPLQSSENTSPFSGFLDKCKSLFTGGNSGANKKR